MPVALITGASRGLGRALAYRLAADGWDLVVDARNTDALRGAASELRTRGARSVTAISGDVSDAGHRAELARAAREHGRLDLLVNNASVLGPSPQPPLADYPIDHLRHVYEVNVVAPIALTQHVLPLLLAADGSIVNVTSDAAVEPYEGWGGYGSSKAALDHATAILGVENPRLRVYSFDPGDMRTQMHQEAFPDEDISDRPEPETVMPALMRLVDGGLPAGRHRAADLTSAVIA